MVDWRNQFKARRDYWGALLFAALISVDDLLIGWFKIESPWPEGWRWTLLAWVIFIIGSVILFKIYRAVIGHFKQRNFKQRSY